MAMNEGEQDAANTRSYVEQEKAALPGWLAMLFWLTVGSALGHFGEEAWWVIAATVAGVTLIRLFVYGICLHRERWR